MARLNEWGVTLLELLIAMVLLTVALVGLARSFPLAMFGVVLGGYQTTATLLAQQVIEQAKGGVYANIPTLATGGAVCDTSGGGTFVVVTGYDGFARCVSTQVGTPLASTTTVTTVVRFLTSGGDPIYTRVATIITP